ncbi:MAG: excinuclease ABC subunit UvrA [Candidatus Magasanikbacteria bacterium]
MIDKLKIRGARVHNLKNVSLEIPKNKLVVITGLSGSGKSSLAFDTIYAEGQRRYAESLSAYARQFMDVQDKPDVDAIEGLSPTIAIDQKISTQNPRSTVGTVTEIYDYLRLLFARVGTQNCPECHVPAFSSSSGEIVEQVRKLARKSVPVLILSPLIHQDVIKLEDILETIERSGYDTIRLDGKLMKIHDLVKCHFEPAEKHDLEIMIGKINDIKKDDPFKAVNIALELSNGACVIASNSEDFYLTTFSYCKKCGRKMPELDVRSFSFNSPFGACPRCTGLGVTMEVDAEMVMPNTRLSLSEGAIQPWMRITGNQTWYQKLLQAVAEHNNFSLDIPVADLPSRVLDLVLYGTGSDIYEVENKKVTFSGVVSDLLKRHLETNSEYVRKEIEQYMREKTCPVCEGKRLRQESLWVKLNDFNIADIAGMSVEESLDFFKKIDITVEKNSKDVKAKVTDTILKELKPRLQNLSQVGLNYLSLDRSMNTLSGGEVTRVRLATQLSSGLTGVIYILDEPSVGLHSRDNDKLISTLKYLRDLGNSVLVVEHDSAMMEAADYLIDVGPGAGIYGGHIVAAGTYEEIKKNKDSITGAYLSGRESIYEKPKKEIKKEKKKNNILSLIGASAFNLKNVSVDIPLNKMVCVTGVSGSGKSALVIHILATALSKHFFRSKEEPGAYKEITGLENLDKVISINQSPIGRTPRSNPATYTGIFTLIRDLFSGLPESRMRLYDAGKFSFNVKGGGRCEACAGEGYVRIPMQFLADVFVTCNECNGTRYNQEVLEVHYLDKNIAEVLNMTVEEAYKFFSNVPTLSEKLNVLRNVGLGYLTLGQPATTLSGGEAQRIKLATELARVSTGNTLYILDEPTTGLHFEDIKRLLVVLKQLVEKGNTVLVIEHNLDVIKSCDWVVELGPEGGKGGGEIVFTGIPEDLAKNKKSWTGKYL